MTLRKLYNGKFPRFTRAFTLIEAVVAVALIGITITGSLLSIQWNRLQSRNIALEMVAQNVTASLMEMVKRSGYNEIVYGANLPDLLEVSATSSLLNFPAGDSPTTPTLPAGPAGNASSPDDYNMNDGVVSNALLSETNYLTMSQDQIAALNGYADAASVPSDMTLLNPQLSWGIFIAPQTAALPEQPILINPVTLVVIIVKWQSSTASFGSRVRFTTLSTLVSNKTARI